ncbi:MAG: L-aspartate oxidase [Magnetococcales bacterium]|nr:L-aspartate oxidase [Magnetococcales bacterium]
MSTLFSSRPLTADFLIIGAGVAGLDLALRMAGHGDVLVLTKAAEGESNSYYAQGGIAAVLDPADDLNSHIADTLIAGAGLCHEDTVRQVVENGPRSIRRLLDLGAPFTRDESQGGFHLTKEGGHSTRRVIHTADATGRAVMELLLERAKQHPRIRILADHMAIDLVTARKLGIFAPGQPNRCYGCYALEIPTGRVATLQARFTILASGGAGKVYRYTSNPDIATGDGIAMAYRAGCRVANMEFIQFHPTCLYHPKAKSFLISEAVRGEGGILVMKNGEPFMQRHHPRADLAPRDIVARAIDYEMKRSGDPCVYLDITAKGKSFIEDHFPNIHKKCLELGIDMTSEPMPVVPAAHYTCGGVVTDLHGRADIDGLFAIGEVSHTGLHGANRLASNSLLECLVFAEAAGNAMLNAMREHPRFAHPDIPLWDSFDCHPCHEAVLISHNWDEIRRFMGNYVGIVRSNRRLHSARRRIELVQREINEHYWNCRISRDLLELRNIAVVASLIIRSAIHRKESRGLHYTTDYPDKDDANWCHDTILPITE